MLNPSATGTQTRLVVRRLREHRTLNAERDDRQEERRHADQHTNFDPACAGHDHTHDGTWFSASRWTHIVQLAACYRPEDGWETEEVLRTGIDNAWRFQLTGNPYQFKTIVYARCDGVLSLVWIQEDDAAWAPVQINDIIDAVLDRLATADLTDWVD
jgi:hypothetical protein